MDIQHGTGSAYSWHKCRCDICVSAKRERDRDYYQRNTEARKAKAREYYAENKESAAERARDYRERNADAIKAGKRRYYDDHRDEIIEKVRQWAEDNPERRKSQQARYREVHRDERNATNLAYYYKRMHEHPERIRAIRRAWAKTSKGIAANRSARHQRRSGVPFTKEAVEWIASLVAPLCVYCGKFATEIDHIIPLSRGGTGDRDNLVPACRKCNAKKGNRTLAEFLASDT